MTAAPERGSGRAAAQIAMSEPSPSASQPKAAAEPRRRRRALLALLALPALLLLLLVSKIGRQQEQITDPTPTSSVSGTTVDVLPKDRFERNGPSWATGATTSTNGEYAERLVGWPDVFPETAHSSYAWYASRPDRGTEWVVADWGSAWEVREIVVLETFNPGAIVAIDDVEDFLENKVGAGRFVRLWSGTTPIVSESRALVFRLAQPRRIAALRIVLDAARVPGHNEIDAVGISARRTDSP